MLVQREKAKNHLYKEMVEADGTDQFLPVVASAVGALTTTADPLWRAFSEERPHRITTGQVRDAVAFAAVRSRALATLNGEMMAGVKHAFRRLVNRPTGQAAQDQTTNPRFLDAIHMHIAPDLHRAVARYTRSRNTATPLTLLDYESLFDAIPPAPKAIVSLCSWILATVPPAQRFAVLLQRHWPMMSPSELLRAIIRQFRPRTTPTIEDLADLVVADQRQREVYQCLTSHQARLIHRTQQMSAVQLCYITVPLVATALLVYYVDPTILLTSAALLARALFTCAWAACELGVNYVVPLLEYIISWVTTHTVIPVIQTVFQHVFTFQIVLFVSVSASLDAACAYLHHSKLLGWVLAFIVSAAAIGIIGTAMISYSMRGLAESLAAMPWLAAHNTIAGLTGLTEHVIGWMSALFAHPAAAAPQVQQPLCYPPRQALAWHPSPVSAELPFTEALYTNTTHADSWPIALVRAVCSAMQQYWQFTMQHPHTMWFTHPTLLALLLLPLL